MRRRAVESTTVRSMGYQAKSKVLESSPIWGGVSIFRCAGGGTTRSSGERITRANTSMLRSGMDTRLSAWAKHKRGGISSKLEWSSAKKSTTTGGNTALKRVCSIFAQLLQFIPRLEFEAAVTKHKAERHARGFTWTQFVAMLFCQLGHAQSLREITQGLAASEGDWRGWKRLRVGPRWPTPISIAVGSCIGRYLRICCSGAEPKRRIEARRSSASSTSLLAGCDNDAGLPVGL